MSDSEWVLELTIRLPVRDEGSGVEAFKTQQVEAEACARTLSLDAEVLERRVYKRVADCPTPGYDRVLEDGMDVVCVRRDSDVDLVPGDCGRVYWHGDDGIIGVTVFRDDEDYEIEYASNAEAVRVWEVEG